MKYLILILLLGLMAACKNASDTPALSDEEMLRLLLEKMEREAPKDIPFEYVDQESSNNCTLSKVYLQQVDTNHLRLRIAVTLPSDYVLPMVDVWGEREDKPANRILITMTGSDKSGTEVVRIRRGSEFELEEGKCEIVFDMMPKDLRKMPAGKHELTLNLQSEFYHDHLDSTFSGVHPFECAIQFTAEIAPIFQSTVHFESLELSKEEFEGMGNDFFNGAPETAIHIKCRGERVIYEYTKNNYILHRPMEQVFYHNDPADRLWIGVCDADYGFNPDDPISDTTLSIQELIDTDYQSIQLPVVKSLRLYCTREGRVN